MKVLIVDDSPEMLAIARYWLEREGLQVECTSTGREALGKAADGVPDIILLDIDLPDMTGWDVCRALKSSPAVSHIPVIFLTASVETADVVRGLDLGAVDYVTKPFDPPVLAARVRVGLRTKRLQDLLRTSALLDPLTELPNRGAFEARLREEWDRRGRYGGELALVLLDIDHFKRVNDRWGHRVGDQVLQEVAQRIRGTCRRCDLAARYGGEEFAIIAPSVDAEHAAYLAERIRAAIAGDPVATDRDAIPVTLSAGVSDATGLAESAALVERADEALYRAKRTGRNRVVTLSGAPLARREAPGSSAAEPRRIFPLPS